MNSHGHVKPNKDGSKARCGGPGLCAECSAELATAIKTIPFSVYEMIKDRFISKIAFIPFYDCWEWVGCRDRSGYGKFGSRKIGYLRAHRAALLFFKGIDAGEMFVLHKCDNPSCVRPEHLFVGTAKDNYLDMVKKGRENESGRFKKGQTPWSKGKFKKICNKGHEYTKENTTIIRNGKAKVCKKCAHLHYKKWKQKQSKTIKAESSVGHITM